MSHQDTRLLTEAFLEQLDNPSMQKQAADAINDFTRTTMREDGFYRRVIPMLPIGNDELDRQVDTDKPCKVIDKEPNTPAAMSIAFASLPDSFYIHGPRYRVMFDRIVTERAQKDVDELRTYAMDIRQVMSDNQIKDMLAEEDARFVRAMNLVLVGADQVVPNSGVVQWETISGGVTRETLTDATKIMPSTPSRLETVVMMMNNITIKEVVKWGRDEVGGDYSEQLLKNGYAETELLGLKIIITIKQDLVPTNRVYMLADPKFIGKSFELEATTLYVKREAYMLEYFAYETIGGGFGHTGGIAAATFE